MGREDLSRGGPIMSRHLDTDYGRITISDRVLEDLAGIATTECYGVAGMAP
ncbi:MAG: Asp23/Gls24 family envelope stress response protein, partial [Bacillota bacterium]